MTSHRLRRPGLLAALAAALILLLPAEAHPQVMDRLRRRAEDALSDAGAVRRLLERDAPLTTSLGDALAEVPFLDGFDPGPATPMTALPRDAEGSFLVPPGYFAFEARSYCLHPGTEGPRTGYGYLLAPLTGTRADMVRKIVRRSALHPEITQHEVQMLLWSLLARMDFDQLRDDLQVAAARLLDPSDLLELKGASIGNVRREVLERAIQDMPEEARAVFRAEARLRELLQDADARFEDFERVAVLEPSQSAPAEGDYIPAGRWSWHPEGYFVRYLPRGYYQTRFEAFVPEPHGVVRDGRGRIAEVRSPTGETVRLEWEASEVGTGLAGLRAAYLVRSGAETVRLALPGPGGDPSGNPAGALAPVAGALAATLRPSGPARELAELAAALRAGVRTEGAGPRAADVVTRAWMHAFCLDAGACAGAGWRADGESVGEPEDLHGPGGPDPGPDSWYTTAPLPRAAVTVDPSAGAAVPPYGQRLGVSSVPAEDEEDTLWNRMMTALAWASLTEGLPLLMSETLTVGVANIIGLAIPNRLFAYIQGMTIALFGHATDALAGQGDPNDGQGTSDGSGGAGTFVEPERAPGGARPSDPSAPNRTDTDPATAGGASTTGDPAVGGAPGAATGDAGGGEVGSSGSGWTRSSGSDYRRYPPSSAPPSPAPPLPDSVTPGPLADAADAYGAALGTLAFHLEAALDSRLRRDAAQAAGETEWACRQQSALTWHMQRAGSAMVETADRLERLLALSEQYGIEDAVITAEQVAEVQRRLSSYGWSAEEREAARLLGMTEAELEAARRELLEADPATVAGSIRDSARNWAAALRIQGALWRSLPEVIPPWDPAWSAESAGCLAEQAGT